MVGRADLSPPRPRRVSRPYPTITMKTNFHTHTTFCDGKDSAEAMVEAAIAKGFSAIGFSSHSDMVADLSAYRAEIARLRAASAGRIRVFCGLELELAKAIPSEVLGATPDGRRPTCGTGDGTFDYLIGSHHFITASDGGFFAIDNSPDELAKGIRDHFDGDAVAFVKAYYAALRSTLSLDFEIVGHPDLVRKFNVKHPYFDETADWYRAELVKTAEAIAASGKIVEVNTGAISRGWIDDAYPSAEFRALLRARGVRFILSSDAHAAAAIDCAFDRFGAAENYVATPWGDR